MHTAMQGAHAQASKPQAIEHYHMETMLVVNKVTGVRTFYKRVCAVWRRIGKDEHHKIVCDAWKASCMTTAGAVNPKVSHIRHYTTWHFRMSDLRAKEMH